MQKLVQAIAFSLAINSVSALIIWLYLKANEYFVRVDLEKKGYSYVSVTHTLGPSDNLLILFLLSIIFTTFVYLLLKPVVFRYFNR